MMIIILFVRYIIDVINFHKYINTTGGNMGQECYGYIVI